MAKLNVENLVKPIIAMMEKGEIPWQKSWDDKKGLLFFTNRNFVSKKLYHGLNQFVLTAIAQDKGFDSNFWLTFNQAKELGGSIKKGEKGVNVVYSSSFIPKSVKEDKKLTDEEKEDGKIHFLKSYYVWNICQTTGIEYTPIGKENEEEKTFEPLEEAERVIPESCKIKFSPTFNPAYVPSKDRVIMPPKESFESIEEFYGALFHEISHWTGHESRLKRKGISGGHFGDEVYSEEELIAEMSSSFVMSYLGLRSENLLQNTAGYLQNWLEVVKEDPAIMMKAATQAVKAFEFIIN